MGVKSSSERIGIQNRNRHEIEFEADVLADKERGYDVGTSLDTLGFQRESLEIDLNFFTHIIFNAGFWLNYSVFNFT